MKLAELLRIVVISGKMSCQMPVTTNAPQGMGQITLSVNLSKGPQRAGEMGKREFSKEKCKVLH